MVENLLAVQVANAPVRLSPHGKIYFLQATLMKSDYMLGIKNPPRVHPPVSGFYKFQPSSGDSRAPDNIKPQDLRRRKCFQVLGSPQ
jgi:hypothetical protein